MKQNTGLAFVAFASLSLLAACASAPKTAKDEVIKQNSHIAKLSKRLDSSTEQGASYLAPQGYEKVRKLFDRAIAAGQDGDKINADKYSQLGLSQIDSVDRHTSTSQNIFNEVLTNRDRAIRAGAPELFKDEYEKLEQELIEASALIENNRLESAKKQRPELIRSYSQLELKSLKKDAAREAKMAIAEAREKDADDFAPQTLKLAEEELTLALSILEANRNRLDKATVHTKRAIELANRSIQITELIRDFDRRDYSEEDKVLWYQKQLSTINEPLKTHLGFDQENRTTVQTLRNDISALVQARDDLRRDLKSTEAKVEKLASANKSELGKLKKRYEREIRQQSAEREALEKRERDTRERFEYVQSLFSEDEADVYRKRENILVLAHGFYFEPGKSEIKSVNFALLNKIDQAHKKFPNAKLIISGHTDSTGNARKNKILSEKRAANVAKFLKDTKGINSRQISVKGYGAERPVASNSSKEGRSRNRRIEVLIDNTVTL